MFLGKNVLLIKGTKGQPGLGRGGSDKEGLGAGRRPKYVRFSPRKSLPFGRLTRDSVGRGAGV